MFAKEYHVQLNANMVSNSTVLLLIMGYHQLPDLKNGNPMTVTFST